MFCEIFEHEPFAEDLVEITLISIVETVEKQREVSLDYVLPFCLLAMEYMHRHGFPFNRSLLSRYADICRIVQPRINHCEHILALSIKNGRSWVEFLDQFSIDINATLGRGNRIETQSPSFNRTYHDGDGVMDLGPISSSLGPISQREQVADQNALSKRQDSSKMLTEDGFAEPMDIDISNNVPAQSIEQKENIAESHSQQIAIDHDSSPLASSRRESLNSIDSIIRTTPSANRQYTAPLVDVRNPFKEGLGARSSYSIVTQESPSRSDSLSWVTAAHHFSSFSKESIQ